MSISNYSDLKSAVADYLARADLTARIPDFIQLAEARLDRALRALENQTSATVTLTLGEGTIPVNYAEHLSCKWVGSSYSQDLSYAEPDSPEWRFRYRPNADPQMFTIMAGSLIVRPWTAGDAKLYYYIKLSSVALSDANTTNWLLTKCPDLYLHTTLAEAAIYMKDEERAAQFLVLGKADADAANIAADAQKFSLNPMRPRDTGNGSVRAAPVAAV